MKNKFIKVMVAIMVLTTAVFSGACGNKLTETESGKEPAYETNAGELLIMNWGSTRLEREQYALLKEVGYNYAFLGAQSNTATNAENLRKALGYCNEFGLKGLTSNAGKGFTTSNEGFGSYKSLPVPADELIESGAFNGHYCFDEPLSVEQFPTFAEDYEAMLNDFESRGISVADKEYITMLCASNKDGLSYREFFKAYADTVFPKAKSGNVPSLFVDYYPLRVDKERNNYMSEDILTVLESASLALKDYGKASKWIYCLETSTDTIGANLDRDIVKEDITFQYYIGMAFGAKGFMNYHYAVPNYMADKLAPVSLSGSRTDLWYSLKELHEQLRSWENVYLSFDWKGYMALPANGGNLADNVFMANVTGNSTSHERIKNVKNSEDTVIGYFRDQNGNDGFMVNNFTEPSYGKRDNVSITFENATKAVVIFEGEKKTADLSDGTLALSLAGGAAAFVIPY